jgi:hypothetical protein
VISIQKASHGLSGEEGNHQKLEARQIFSDFIKNIRDDVGGEKSGPKFRLPHSIKRIKEDPALEDAYGYEASTLEIVFNAYLYHLFKEGMRLFSWIVLIVSGFQTRDPHGAINGRW